MYSLITRISQIFYFFGICICILLSFNFFIAFFTQLNKNSVLPIINNFEIEKWTSLYKNNYTRVQHANGKFSLDVDLENLKNINTKLVFMYITAEYSYNNIVIL